MNPQPVPGPGLLYAAILAENKALVDALIGPENNKGCSGGGNNLDWVAAYIEAGYGYSKPGDA
jgi:hypothetical protein